ncbi:CCA tRNA nucleotidyltransferase [Nitratiruptor sp. SB155-2]|uniref:CCA tRNA nucleotidyltransferase n=1 Tax=Nitratiruptor sp. (strain SB155-2) TaxID=387092 RepID=UPI00015872F7|nr:CCA tRNA nucleotidyltransferase [Nitratiruptor sp. SB155-2]BAF69842.1 RNA nucleotidyltransferase [Nitratiruptor sp. SB155-2]
MQVNFEHRGRYPELIELLPKHLQKELDILKKFFLDKSDRVYMVGGAVRDLIRIVLEKQPIAIVDLDIEVYGIKPKEFDALMLQLGAKGVGKSFFVYKYKEHIDISLPRIESKVGRGHKAFVVDLAKDEKSASIRRDFKMNALMLNIFTGELLDFWGGVEDIKHKRISIIDAEKFKEDSLRVLRAMQFSARFGYRIEKRSCKVMQGIALDDLSHERIFWEFEKMFQAHFLHFGLYALITLHIDRKLFNVHISRMKFFEIALELMRNRASFQKHLYKFEFLYILAMKLHKKATFFLEILQTPKEYFKAFKKQKAIPRYRSDRFVVGLATNYPIKNWLGNYKQDVTIRAKNFGVWEEKFQPVHAKELMQEGFDGPALGQELRKRTLQIIRQRFAK